MEIWEPTEPSERIEIEGWDAPFDRVSETSPRVKLARRIARTVRKLIDHREPVGIEAARALRRCVDPGAPARRIVRSNHSRPKARRRRSRGSGSPGAAEHIAVMDLMALADALLLPQDDLALATVLRSPLFGFSDQDLFAVAWDRGARFAKRSGKNPGNAGYSLKPRHFSTSSRPWHGAKRHLRFMRRSWAPAAADAAFSLGSASKQRRARRIPQSCLRL